MTEDQFDRPPATEPRRPYAAAFDAAVGAMEDAARRLAACYEPPADPAERLKWANDVAEALARFRTGAAHDFERGSGLFRMASREQAERLDRLPATVRDVRRQLAGLLDDEDYPVLSGRDFYGGLRGWPAPAGQGSLILVGVWNDLRPDRPAARHLGPDDCAITPRGERVLVLDGPTPPLAPNAVDLRPLGEIYSLTAAFDLGAVRVLTRRVADDWAYAATEARRLREAEERREAERLAADPMHQVELLKRQMAELQASKAGAA